MRLSTIPLAALAAIAFLAAAVALEPSPAPREGQLSFVPSPSVESRGATTAAGRVEVQECRMTDEGLVARGRVEAGPGSITVVVSGGDEQAAGVRVGRAFLAHSGVVDEAEPGQFQVLLAWAGLESDFAVVEDRSPDAAHGPPSSCP